ncbi:MAG TPA: hypothetical protein O0X70_02890 [Methanocorpusculum sp.]|nr:hypothetical protein [Methanocorpusculum sp.]
MLVNVSYTDDINSRETKGFAAFQEAFGGSDTQCLILMKNLEKTQEEITYIPVWKWLLTGSEKTGL